jgi:hypothetical protein
VERHDGIVQKIVKLEEGISQKLIESIQSYILLEKSWSDDRLKMVSDFEIAMSAVNLSNGKKAVDPHGWKPPPPLLYNQYKVGECKGIVAFGFMVSWLYIKFML